MVPDRTTGGDGQAMMQHTGGGGGELGLMAWRERGMQSHYVGGGGGGCCTGIVSPGTISGWGGLAQGLGI